MASNTDYSKYIIPLGVVGVAYFGLETILEKLGISDPQAQANKAALQPGTAFSPTFYQNYTGKKLLLTQSTANDYAEKIYNSVHAFWANEPAVFIGVMQAMKTKTQVSFLADTFQKIYGTGMLAYLLQYLTSDQIADGIRIANALPNYTA